MKKGWSGLLLVLFFLLFSTSVLGINKDLVGKEKQMKLLAVQEDKGNYKGSIADLFLELKEGSGRVFLDTFPLTKLDTQISTRFAKEIACKHFKLDCDQYDFIFTIKAESNIIGGPSAGAAVAALTTITMLDLDYNQDITITGTINSGGIIGPVGGIKEKLEAAAEANLTRVLVAKGTSKQKSFGPSAHFNDNQTNQNETIEVDLIQYGEENLSLEVIEVMELDEVLLQMTGINLNSKEVQINESPEYKKIMKSLQEILCSRTKKIESELKDEGVRLNQSIREQSALKIEKAENATKKEDYYSAASFCFGNNIFLKKQFYRQKKPTKETLTELFKKLEIKTSSLKDGLKKEKIETIADLQTVMVVKERLNDVSEQLNKSKEGIDNQPLEESYDLLAYAEERFFSALSWTQFFSMEGKKFILDEELLKNSCIQKISEAEERHQYVSLFLRWFSVIDIKEKIESAEEASEKGEYELCLIKAAQAKADANAILSSLGLDEENFAAFLESKVKAVERVISENSAEGIFPILGYSYYQYANSLKEQEKYTALIYLEYALEMSELGIYFPEEEGFLEKLEKKFQLRRDWILILEGFLIGILVATFFFLINRSWFRKKPKLKFVRRK